VYDVSETDDNSLLKRRAGLTSNFPTSLVYSRSCSVLAIGRFHHGARQRAKDIYLKQERERLKKAAIDAGCTGWKSRESTMRKMGLAEFLLLDQSALQTLYALSLKTERTRGDNGCFVSPAFAPDNLSLQELADAVVPAPAAPGEKLKREIAVALGRSFAAMAANSKGGAVSVSVCIAEEGLC
jgi:hypothetical protein